MVSEVIVQTTSTPGAYREIRAQARQTKWARRLSPGEIPNVVRRASAPDNLWSHYSDGATCNPQTSLLQGDPKSESDNHLRRNLLPRHLSEERDVVENSF